MRNYKLHTWSIPHVGSIRVTGFTMTKTTHQGQEPSLQSSGSPYKRPFFDPMSVVNE